MRTRVFRLRSASVVSFPRSRGSEQIFGVGLDEVMQHQAALFPSLKVPFLLVNLAADLFAYGGTHETGLFRLCVAEGDVLLAMKHISSEPDFILHDKNPHLAAVLIKRFLMTLPEPLCPWALYESAIQAAKAPSSDTKLSVISFPCCQCTTKKWLNLLAIFCTNFRVQKLPKRRSWIFTISVLFLHPQR
jgi:hypothetical protein